MKKAANVLIKDLLVQHTDRKSNESGLLLKSVLKNAQIENFKCHLGDFE